jgi:hypothetical protein
VTLCNRCDEDWSCYPSVKLIAEETGMSERTVREHLDALEGIGAMRRDRTRNSDGTLGRYRYFVQRHFQPLAKSAGGEAKGNEPAADTATGEKAHQPAAKSAAQVNRQIEPSPISLNEPFEALWSMWPAAGRTRSKAKAKVFDQFKRACDKHQPEQILNATKLWLRTITPEFAPALERFLRDERFEHHMPRGNVVAMSSEPNWPVILRDWMANKGWPANLGPKPHEPDYRGPLEPLRPLLAGKDPEHPIIAALLAKLEPQLSTALGN